MTARGPNGAMPWPCRSNVARVRRRNRARHRPRQRSPRRRRSNRSRPLARPNHTKTVPSSMSTSTSRMPLDKMPSAATKLDQIVGEFADLEPRERLELLLEFAEGLPPLPPRYQAEKDRGEHRVHECQTPVFLWVEVNDGRVQVYADVAPEAPTVKGFVNILVEAFNGATADEALEV